MKFCQEHIALFLIGAALVYWYCSSGNGMLSYKNSGNVRVATSKNSNSQKPATPTPTPTPTATPPSRQQLIKGASGHVLAPVEPGVGTASLEERLNEPPGIGWDSSALLPEMTSSGLDTMSPIEFAHGENFLQPHAQIGSVADSNRNPNMSLRRDPEITPKTVGPWQQSTIYPDPFRKPLDCL